MSVILQETGIRSGEYLPVVLTATNAALWDWDLRTNKVLVTARWYELFGYAPGEFEVTAERWHSILHQDDLRTMLSGLEEYFAGRTPVFELEWRGVHKLG